MGIKKVITVFLVCAGLCSCGGGDFFQTELSRRRKAIEANPAQRLENYAFKPESSLIARAGTPPAVIMTYLEGLDSRPYKAYVPSGDKLALVKASFQLLPAAHREILKRKLIGLYFVRDFSSSGLTLPVFDRDGNIYSLMVFNSKVLTDGVSSLLSRKENTAFARLGLNSRVEVNCGVKYTGFLYILLHEATQLVRKD